MQGTCAGATSGQYKTGHNPAVWFTDLASAASGGDGSCAVDDLPFSTSTFDPATLADFTWITPNRCDDMDWMSGCPEPKANRVAYGDAWLQGVLGTIFQSSDYQQGQTLVLEMWDEGQQSGKTIVNGADCTAVSNIDTSGCHVALIAASAYITPHTTDATPYSHYSVLAALETMWGLPLINRAQTAPPLAPAMGF